MSENGRGVFHPNVLSLEVSEKNASALIGGCRCFLSKRRKVSSVCLLQPMLYSG